MRPRFTPGAQYGGNPCQLTYRHSLFLNITLAAIIRLAHFPRPTLRRVSALGAASAQRPSWWPVARIAARMQAQPWPHVPAHRRIVMQHLEHWHAVTVAHAIAEREREHF